MKRRIQLRCLLLVSRTEGFLILRGIALNRWLVERLRDVMNWTDDKFDEIMFR